MKSRNLPKLLIRLPADVKEWVVEQATHNSSSQSSEIVRALRERMKRRHAIKLNRGKDEQFPLNKGE